ncbi:cellulase family glycosylhydrolase [Acaryochloris sp. CCMEE 5410]|uniref:cellulase family glycosylhydrolase n=1 Tax=Acaryochloris sp. CCMEE 5410 TaxID=310037 RepID=UPI0021D278E5|nr:cellulase family glycosylhydrolase [Acaryochloris sp. CCMEE 5410]KAI9131010.1 cellulase family glycosylhydrolase [Acaryochloris sp. CCMEE 5410]
MSLNPLHQKRYRSAFAMILFVCTGILSGCSHSYAKPHAPIRVDWNQSTGSARNVYSLNLWSATDPTVGANLKFGEQLGQIRPSICRLHAAEMLKVGHGKAWIDKKGAWDIGKIDAILKNIAPHCEDIMISIPSWSPTLYQGSQLPPEKHRAFAQWCAQLVRLVSSRHLVRYFEILNEKDPAYNGNSQELAKLAKQTAHAMRRANPAIRIVVGAWTHPYDKRDIQAFLEASKTSDIQAFSYHQYGTHQPSGDPFKLYKTAKIIGQRPKAIRQWMNQKGLHNAELFLGETHMFTTWDRDKQKLMRTHHGAVFLALVFQQAAQHNDIDGIFPWNDADNTYGLFNHKDGVYSLRSAGYVLKLLRQYFSHGQRIRVSTPRGIDAFAVRTPSSHSLMIINSHTYPSKITRLDMRGWQPPQQRYQLYTIDSDGIRVSQQTWDQQQSQTLHLPNDSVSFLNFSGESSPNIDERST